MTTIELTRQISDHEFQFEDCQTRRARTLKRDEILSGVYGGRLLVVLAEQARITHEHKANQALDLTSLNEKERERLDRSYELVKAIQKAKISRGRKKEIEAFVDRYTRARSWDKPATSTVMNWLRRYELSNHNPLSLVVRYRVARRKKRVCADIEQLMVEVLKKEYFTKARATARHAYERFNLKLYELQKNGSIPINEHIPSYQTFTRRIQDVDLYHRIATREGQKRASLVCRTSFPNGHPTYPLERVEIDHTPLNYVVMCDRSGLPLGRPILSVMLDSFSGYVLGFYVSFYGAGLSSVCGLIKNAIAPKAPMLEGLDINNEWLAHGLGDEWIVDNGLEFHSRGFKQIAQTLGVDLMYAKVRTPWLKPRVERFFAGLNSLTLQKGRVFKYQANDDRIDPYKGAAITFEDLVHGLMKFFIDIYPHQVNSRKMSTPFELFNEGLRRCPPAVYPGNVKDLKLVAGMSRRLTFTQGGIELEGLPFGSYQFKDLANRFGTGFKVDIKFDPDDIHEIFVQHPETKNWIAAQCRWPHYSTGLSLNQHKHIKANALKFFKRTEAQAALLKAKDELHQHWLSSTRSTKRSDSLKAARFSGLTSERVLTRSESSTQEVSTQVEDVGKHIYLPEDAQEEKQIPDFETFLMRQPR